ncbi:MAG: hypothetical protein QGG64_16720, partial [Candidatus Latescibacteria bacterium]|nr:hypothetical protein [Candidatus Latescibacterota bacterium]
YIMVMPTVYGAHPMFHIWEIGPIVGMLALFFWAVFQKLKKHNLMPVNDPYLVESLPQHTSEEVTM